MLKFKIILLSIKIKIIKFFFKEYDPFFSNENSFYFSPSYFLKDFKNNIKNENFENPNKKRKKLNVLLNINEKK